jgi:hypothetical protein
MRTVVVKECQSIRGSSEEQDGARLMFSTVEVVVVVGTSYMTIDLFETLTMYL